MTDSVHLFDPIDYIIFEGLSAKGKVEHKIINGITRQAMHA